MFRDTELSYFIIKTRKNVSENILKIKLRLRYKKSIAASVFIDDEL